MNKLSKKFLVLFSLLFLLNISVFARSKQTSQVIEAGHWIYEDLVSLSMEAGNTFYLETQPLTVGEIKLYLYSIEYNDLSDSGKVVYDKVSYYLDLEDNFFESDTVRLFLNAQLNPEFFYKSNDDLDLSFKNKYKDYALTFPIILGFSDFVTIQSNPVVTKSELCLHHNGSFTNIPFSGSELDFYLPKFAYASYSKMFDEWGFSFHIGHEGMQVGQTSLDSVVYSRNFETDFYSQISLFNKYFKYTLNVNQIEKDRFYYLHQLTLRPFHNLNFGVLEGSLLNAPFELRYLNPLMFMHQFGSWYQYDDFSNPYSNENYTYYNEGRFCAFLGFTLEYIPFKNMRIYGLYGQNEILDAGGSRSEHALSVPDSIAAQLGIEYNFALPNTAFLKTGLEAVYASPFYMVKHSPDWSLYRNRNNQQWTGPIHSWMGTPFGPDNFTLEARVKYEPNHKWSVGANVLFAINGQNNYNTLFNDSNKIHVLADKNDNLIKDKKGNLIKIDEVMSKDDKGYLKDSTGNYILKDYDKEEIDSNKYHYSEVSNQWLWTYYPSVKHNLGGGKKVSDDARYMWMTGTPEYKTTIGINGHYKILDNLDISGAVNYTFTFNNKNQKGVFEQGFESIIAISYNLF